MFCSAWHIWTSWEYVRAYENMVDTIKEYPCLRGQKQTKWHDSSLASGCHLERWHGSLVVLCRVSLFCSRYLVSYHFPYSFSSSSHIVVFSVVRPISVAAVFPIVFPALIPAHAFLQVFVLETIHEHADLICCQEQTNPHQLKSNDHQDID